ncbi:hypothetical protein LUZ63_014637 [Rhynchospora breviuscula]|uniref:BED-type domain-containing protein n=1 Tax=Rhynchospora breviuscula TaxID=2022672 RepID=A0A9Q0CAV9_9POAL|nr:hypothetical protein LUZ63_014637 [Rhynchospora breviuscula]
MAEPDNSASEPDLEYEAEDDDDTLHPDLTAEQVQNIEDEANAQDPQSAPQGERIESNAPEVSVQITKKRRFKENLTAEVWKHFTKGKIQDDGSYDAVCKYCGLVYQMGNQRGTGSLNHHIKKGCKKVPNRYKRNKLQQMLQVQPGPVADLALQLRPAINRYAALDKNYKLKLDDEEWEAVEALMDSLKIFYRATLKFSATKYPSLNFFFTEMCEVYINIKKMESSPYPFIVLMTQKVFPKWERYWTNGNTLLAIACVLDPRCKITVVEYYFKMMYPTNYEWYISNLNACISALFKEYLEAHFNKSQSQPGSSSRHQSQSTQACGASSAGSDMVNEIRAGLKDYMQGKKTAEPVQSKLEEYLCEPLDETSLDEEFDILAWWKLKVPKYPVLSQLTRDILAVPASTVASESTFSISGRTQSPERSCLNDESMEALICAQDWLRARVAENGGDIGAPMWPSAEPVSDDTICGSLKIVNLAEFVTCDL